MSYLAYTFWHWKRASIDAARYEEQQRAFHTALAANPPDGFQLSISSALSGAPWANSGGDAYQDRYIVRDFAALETLEQAAISGARRSSHDSAASVAAGGSAGIYSARVGSPVTAPRHALYFSKPEGMSYADLTAALSPLARDGEAVLWMRRMVLGPSEFCLESVASLQLPAGFEVRATLSLRPLWP